MPESQDNYLSGYEAYMSLSFQTFSLRPALSLLSVVLLGVGCGVGPVTDAGHPASVGASGSVHGGQQPVTGSLIQLYAVGTAGPGSASTPLISAVVTTSDGTGQTNANANTYNNFNQMPAGSFSLAGTFTCPTAATQVFLAASGGNPGLAPGTTNPALTMFSALGPCGGILPSALIQINELTTVSSIAPLVPYMSAYNAVGSAPVDAPALAAALTLVRSYTDLSSGTVPGPSLQPGYYASTLEATTLADILAGCINSSGTTSACQQLFTLATPPAGVAPTDTIGAALDILKYPTNNTAAIFALLSATAPFQPALTAPPATWSLPILPYTAAPIITPASGTFTSAPTITITDATPGASIFYSLDGSTPTIPYTAQVNFSTIFNKTSRTVRALATTPNYATSPTASATYTLPTAGTAVALAFITQPAGAPENVVMPTFSVGIVDAYGTPVLATGYSVTITLTGGTGTVTGTRTVTTNNGVATFSNVYVAPGGATYNFTATAYQLNASVVSAPFIITPPPITFTVAGNTIGAGATLSGTFTLPSAAPAGGVTVALTSSNPAAITIAPATVAVAAGSTTGSFTYTSVGPGASTLKASASPYADGTTLQTTAANFITISGLPTTPGTSFLPFGVTLSTPAPAGGVFVTLASSNTSVASISSSTFISAGATQPASLPVIQARTIGTSMITAAATGYAPDSKALNSTGTFSVTQGLTALSGNGVSAFISLNQTSPTLTTFTLKSDNPLVATVPATTTVSANNPYGNFVVTATGVGSTTIHVSSPLYGEVTTSIAITGTLTITHGHPAALYYSSATVNLGQHASPVSVTLTSSNPAVLLLTTDPSIAGTASITLSNATAASPVFYELGLGGNISASNVTATAAGYGSVTSQVYIYAPTVNMQDAPTNISLIGTPPTFYVSLGELDNTNNYAGPCVSTGGKDGFPSLGCGLLPGNTVTLPLTNVNPAAATLSATSVTLAYGQPNALVVITPVAAGSSTISIPPTPTGFRYAGRNSFPIYIDSPGFTPTTTTTAVTFAGVTVSQSAFGLSTPDTSASGATVTITATGGLVGLSLDPNVIGGSSLVFPGIRSTIPSMYLQGLNLGTGSLIISSPGYKTKTLQLAVIPATVVLSQSFPINVTTADNTPYAISLNLSSGGFLNPGANNVFTIVSSNPAVGIVNNPLIMAPMTSIASGTFTGLSGGTTTLTVGTPPSPLIPPTVNYGTTSLTANVTQARFTSQNQTIGASVQITGGGSGSFGTALTTPVNVNITSSNPAVAVLSTSTATLGSATLSFANTKSIPAYYIQGLSIGTTTITISAPGSGYASATSTVTVLATGITFDNVKPATFTTTGFSNPTTIDLQLATINANGTVNAFCGQLYYCIPNPGAVYTVGIANSNVGAGTITPTPVTFAPGASLATTTFVPQDVGVTTLSLIQPTGLTASAGYNTGIVTVTGDATSIGNIAIGAGSYIATSASLATIPPKPVSMTVTILDSTLARISTDPAVLGASNSITFNNITCLTFYCTVGGPPQFYVQGIAAGFTKISVAVKGYVPSTGTVAVYKMGMTLALAINNQYIGGQIGGTNVTSAPAYVSLLDPYSNAFISDCNIFSPCNLNPGVSAPQTTLVLDDPSIGSFAPSSTTFNQIGQATLTYTPLKSGLSNYTIASQSPGYFQTSTPQKRSGIAATSVKNDLTNVLYIAAHDVDAGVGVEVVGSFALPATVFGYDTTPYTITVADPTVAVISLLPTTTGAAVTTLTTVDYLNHDFYVQGLKVGTTTVTITKSQYQSRTFTITVRPAGFVMKQFDFTAKITNRDFNVSFTPAILNDQGQWLGNAQMNPGVSATVPVASSNPGAASILLNGTIAAAGTSGTFTVHPILPGLTTFTLGTPGTTLTKATTYQAVTATIQ
jgi:hypothetical protein